MVSRTARNERKFRTKTSNSVVWIGKNGVTQAALAEITTRLDKKRMIKVRILKTALKQAGVRTIGATIAEQTDSLLMDVRGHTLILHKKEAGT
ncbi:MAG: YhbY family RNA-binding protein [Candidatus Bathyarchaeota archaeon]|nr:MAG: YhbY family RNA-binding protein [Candidatus Bathyarchaeota archaeon]